GAPSAPRAGGAPAAVVTGSVVPVTRATATNQTVAARCVSARMAASYRVPPAAMPTLRAPVLDLRLKQEGGMDKSGASPVSSMEHWTEARGLEQRHEELERRLAELDRHLSL